MRENCKESCNVCGAKGTGDFFWKKKYQSPNSNYRGFSSDTERNCLRGKTMLQEIFLLLFGATWGVSLSKLTVVKSSRFIRKQGSRHLSPKAPKSSSEKLKRTPGTQKNSGNSLELLESPRKRKELRGTPPRNSSEELQGTPRNYLVKILKSWTDASTQKS